MPPVTVTWAIPRPMAPAPTIPTVTCPELASVMPTPPFASSFVLTIWKRRNHPHHTGRRKPFPPKNHLLNPNSPVPTFMKCAAPGGWHTMDADIGSKQMQIALVGLRWRTRS
jgi:hypothetical protein